MLKLLFHFMSGSGHCGEEALILYNIRMVKIPGCDVGPLPGIMNLSVAFCYISLILHSIAALFR